MDQCVVSALKRKCGAQAEPRQSEDAADALIERGEVRIGPLGGSEGETIGEADAEGTPPSSVAGEGRIGSLEADAQRSNCVDCGAHRPCFLCRTYQGLRIVDGAEKQLHPIISPAAEGASGGAMVRVGAIKRSDHHICVEYTSAHKAPTQARSSERNSSR